MVALGEAAVAGGAEVIGVAGGDGSQALVAGGAARHRVPMVVVPAGTIRSPAYRDAELDTTLSALPDLLGPGSRPFDLRFRIRRENGTTARTSSRSRTTRTAAPSPPSPAAPISTPDISA